VRSGASALGLEIRLLVQQVVALSRETPAS
jgi:hypothetical protein